MDKRFVEAQAVGRIKSALDAIMEELNRGERRGAAQRRRIWNEVAIEANACLSRIPEGAAPRAKKATKVAATVPPLPNVA